MFLFIKVIFMHTKDTRLRAKNVRNSVRTPEYGFHEVMIAAKGGCSDEDTAQLYFQNTVRFQIRLN